MLVKGLWIITSLILFTLNMLTLLVRVILMTRGTIQTNAAYDFYHILVNERTFRKLFKSSAQNYINQSEEYVVQ